MRLLLTRAADDAARTRAKLLSAGHQVMVSSVIAVVATHVAWPPGVVDAVVATSGHAFAALDLGPTLEARRLMPLLLVGQRTAAIAREHGFAGPSLIAANATELAVAMPDLPNRPARLVYIAGRDRKSDLETALAMIGQALEVIEVYEAQTVAALTRQSVEALRIGTLEGVLHFSRRSVETFLALALQEGVAVSALTHFCLSEDVATPLREAGCPIIAVAKAPNEPALLKLVGNGPGT